MLAALVATPLAFTPATRLPARSCCAAASPRVRFLAATEAADVEEAPGEQPPAKALTAEDMELTGSIITYADLSEDFQQLVDEALMRRDRARMLNGQPKYGSVEGMIDAYEELGKPKGWTRVEAESEVVRYLQRQALRDEGGLDGSAQDTPTFVLLGLVVASAIYGAAVKYGLVPTPPPAPW